jgi:hypothetical protein
MSAPAQLDLLNPSSDDLRGHYIHQLKQTILAYSAPQIVVGEGLQNAIDVIVQCGHPNREITVDIDFTERTVRIRDSGSGFPNDPRLLFLGGTYKKEINKKIFGLVGVGIKVVLFSTDQFQIRSKMTDGSTFKYRIDDAYKFDQESRPELLIPAKFDADDKPLDGVGTELTYRFPKGAARDPIQEFVDDVIEKCLPKGIDDGFVKAITFAVERKEFDNRFSALLEAYFRRYTYVGDILNTLGQKDELKGAKVVIAYTCADPAATLPKAAPLFDGQTGGKVSIDPTYLLVRDVNARLPAHEKTGMSHLDLGHGGSNLSRHARAFNLKEYCSPEDYEKLLIGPKGVVPAEIVPSLKEYREKLFPRINGIILTIGRIPNFEEMLPGGSRRVLSCNGVVTTHEIDLTRGRNQSYIRCFDLLIDVAGVLNYGKSQLTDMHLLSRVRRFINDAYMATIQLGATNWVGRIVPPDEEDEKDIFVARQDLGLADYVLQKQPRDENDVIALFFEMAGKGLFKDYRVYGLSQSDQYDARAMIKRVGEKDMPPHPADDRQAMTVEFKIDASAVIKDFEREIKNAKDINLLIAWREGTSTSEQFLFADIKHSKHYPARVFPGVQRYLLDTRTDVHVQVLLLEPLIEMLKNPKPPEPPPPAAPEKKTKKK